MAEKMEMLPCHDHLFADRATTFNFFYSVSIEGDGTYIQCASQMLSWKMTSTNWNTHDEIFIFNRTWGMLNQSMQTVFKISWICQFKKQTIWPFPLFSWFALKCLKINTLLTASQLTRWMKYQQDNRQFPSLIRIPLCSLTWQYLLWSRVSHRVYACVAVPSIQEGSIPLIFSFLPLPLFWFVQYDGTDVQASQN